MLPCHGSVGRSKLPGAVFSGHAQPEHRRDMHKECVRRGRLMVQWGNGRPARLRAWFPSGSVGSSPTWTTMAVWGNGRPARFRIWCPQGRVGSSPTTATEWRRTIAASTDGCACSGRARPISEGSSPSSRSETWGRSSSGRAPVTGRPEVAGSSPAVRRRHHLGSVGQWRAASLKSWDLMSRYACRFESCRSHHGDWTQMARAHAVTVSVRGFDSPQSPDG